MHLSIAIADRECSVGAGVRAAIFGLAMTATLLALSGCRLFLVPEETGPELTGVIQSVDVSGGIVSLEPGLPPEDPSAPGAQASGNHTMIPGGGTGVRVTADVPFDRVFAWVDGRAGHYRVDLDAPHESVELVLVYGHDLSDAQYDFRFAVGNGAGAGDSQGHPMSVISVGTGDVQVSVSWDVPSDVDLYVVDPDGEEIFYGNRSSSNGGELDLDSNAACSGSDARNENITWSEGTAPRGEYTVRLNYWAGCGQARTNWVVTVRVDGRPAESFTGYFAGSGNGGASGAGELVTTFTY